MTCYHPIRAIVLGVDEFGKKQLQFCHKPLTIEESLLLLVREEIWLPCGKCIGCKIKRSADWATRLMLECKEHEKACFVTLTYNDENVPKRTYVDCEGELQTSLTLRKRDLQLFMKRLRKFYQPEKIRFFACGEYGSETFRPHYHLILFGCDFKEDIQILNYTEEGHINWVSPILDKLWPFGYHMINEVNWQTCAYVARYVQKKRLGAQNIYYQTFNIDPEFNLMSRRPGIAHDWYMDHKDEVYINQEIFLANPNGGKKVRPPTYFDRLYDIDCPEEMAQIREARKEMAKNVMALKLEKSSKNYYELLEDEERIFKQRTDRLVRNKI